MPNIKKRYPSWNKQRNKKSLLPAVIIVILLGGLSWLFFITGDKEEIDPVTFCPENGPTSTVVIIFDTSDPFTPNQIVSFQQFMESLPNKHVKKGQLLAIYKIADTTLRPNRLFWQCNPGGLSESSPLTEGRIWAMSRWQGFVNELLDALPAEATLEATDAPISPIIETIQYVRAKEFPSSSELKTSGQTAGTIFIISDMLQNSDKLTHFTQRLPAVEDSLSKFALDLTGIKIGIRYLKSDKYAHLQQGVRPHFTWWRRFFSRANSPLELTPEEW